MLEYFSEFYRLFTYYLLDLQQDSFRIIIQLLNGLLSDLQEITMIGYPDPEEFIQIAAVYGQELDSLHQRHIRVFGLLKDPVIEIKPAIIAVDKPGCL